ncbi:hypothetical protein BDR04DRAFT_42812 [Suillus decipiens]|nr:hypothetical protein BDR04DRAFT_42812 [Suillus decipiens]
MVKVWYSDALSSIKATKNGLRGLLARLYALLSYPQVSDTFFKVRSNSIVQGTRKQTHSVLYRKIPPYICLPAVKLCRRCRPILRHHSRRIPKSVELVPRPLISNMHLS